MSSIESIGVCPNCSKTTLTYYNSMHLGFEFDACPHCSYLNTGEVISKEQAKEVWKDIISHSSTKTLSKLQESIEAIGYIDGERKQVFTLPDDLESYIIGTEELEIVFSSQN